MDWITDILRYVVDGANGNGWMVRQTENEELRNVCIRISEQDGVDEFFFFFSTLLYYGWLYSTFIPVFYF
jgi:hypothetical protein